MGYRTIGVVPVEGEAGLIRMYATGRSLGAVENARYLFDYVKFRKDKVVRQPPTLQRACRLGIPRVGN